MDKLIKKVLTNKTYRNEATLSALIAATMNAGMPWTGK